MQYIAEVGVVNHTYNYGAIDDDSAIDHINGIAQAEYDQNSETVLYLAEVPADGSGHRVIIDRYED